MTSFRTVLTMGCAVIGMVALATGPARVMARAPQQEERAPSDAPPTTGDISRYYEVETIALPEGEPSADGIAVMPDGRIVVAFYDGRVRFLDVATRQWTTFAEGLHSPLGVLPVSNRELLVMQMPELTALVDRDGDGRADQYRTVSDGFGLSGNYAEFGFGPVRDADGSLYISLGTGSHFGAPLTGEVRGFFNPLGSLSRMTSPVPYRGWILKVTPEGETIPWASGLREPNGLGISPDGQLFAIDNQGDWVGSSSLYAIEEGRFYGHAPDLLWREDFQGGRRPIDMPVEELDRLRTRAAVVFPYGDMSNSPTQPTWDTTGGEFGPFSGQVFLGEMNQPYLLRVMLEQVDGQTQGAVAPFLRDTNRPLLERGNNRFAFDGNGDLWIGQTLHRGWVGHAGIQRVSWKGVVPLDVLGMSLTDDGFELTFTRPVDPAAAGRAASYAMQTYFYNYHEGYGSGKFDVRPVAITSATVSDDRRRVRLVVDRLEAWRLYDLTMTDIVSEDGEHPLLGNWVVYTLNHLRSGTPPPRAPIPQEQPARRTPIYPRSTIESVGGPQNFAPLPPELLTNLPTRGSGPARGRGGAAGRGGGAVQGGGRGPGAPAPP